MNVTYLYKDEVPDLANDRFSSDDEYADYLNSFNDPEVLFESLIHNRATVDRFSWIVDDYLSLEQQLSGTTLSNGMEYSLRRLTPSSNDVYGYVRYILPGTSAESAGLTRGAVFSGVDGTPLTIDNFRSLLSPDSYTINLATYNDNGTTDTDDDSLTPLSNSVTLNKVAYTENPILINSVLNVNGSNVGYLMYNRFGSSDTFVSQLNSVFGNFKSSNITELVLDLRYNPGGSVNTAIWLASMITGQFTDEIFVKEEWNSEQQALINNSDPNLLLNPFVDQMIKRNGQGEIIFQETINKLNLNKLYVLTSSGTASASELIINGLKPYIDVIQIGTNTAGKYQASVTLYDSPNFRRQDVNPLHTYALQPLIFKSLNKNGVTDYIDGLMPDTEITESVSNLGILGDINEPLLAEALFQIENTFRASIFDSQIDNFIGDSNDLKPLGKEMYLD